MESVVMIKTTGAVGKVFHDEGRAKGLTFQFFLLFAFCFFLLVVIPVVRIVKPTCNLVDLDDLPYIVGFVGLTVGLIQISLLRRVVALEK
jgi:hypothetical protein